jgi:hypothetical protein
LSIYAVLIEFERSEYIVSEDAGQLPVCLTVTNGELIPGTTVTVSLTTSSGNEAGTYGDETFFQVCLNLANNYES